MNILSYATPSYEIVYNHHLKASLDRLGIEAIHKSVDATYNWIEATNIKPGIILEELRKGQSLLYVDSDAEINGIEVLKLEETIPPSYIGACHFLDWAKWYGRGVALEPLTGTLFFRTTAIPLLEKWVAKAKGNSQPDGHSFAELVNFCTPEIYHLPLEYCYINSLPIEECKGGIPCERPLITHFQASRRHR